MRWVILTDNRTNDSRMLTEHGLSVYVETKRYKLLLDTGASDTLGGFHLLDGYERDEELLRLAHHLKTDYPNVQFYTSHCTGDAALRTIQQVLGMQIQGFTCGQVCSE